MTVDYFSRGTKIPSTAGFSGHGDPQVREAGSAPFLGLLEEDDLFLCVKTPHGDNARLSTPTLTGIYAPRT